MNRAQAFDSPCLNRKYPKLLVFTRFPVLVNVDYKYILGIKLAFITAVS